MQHGYLQATQGENTQHAQSLHQTHLQAPDHGDWHQENQEIGGDTASTNGDEEKTHINTLSLGCGIEMLFPEVAVWSTLENDNEEGRNQPPDDEEDNDIYGSVESDHREKSVIKGENGELCQGNHGAVEEFEGPQELSRNQLLVHICFGARPTAGVDFGWMLTWKTGRTWIFGFQTCRPTPMEQPAFIISQLLQFFPGYYYCGSRKRTINGEGI